MEYRLSKHSPTENKVDDRERQYNVWDSGNCKEGFYTSSQLAFRACQGRDCYVAYRLIHLFNYIASNGNKDGRI
ncbi:hypothetical protein TNCV_1032801 [Trichonephila clavipes]|nr:hypothetical protein TNCV_1032801 [Trichonephila clavipes]